MLMELQAGAADRYTGLGKLPPQSRPTPSMMPGFTGTETATPVDSGLMKMIPLLMSQGGPSGMARTDTSGHVGPVGHVSIGSALLPNDPRLVTRHGETLQRAAMRSLLGEHILPHLTSSYRTPSEQAALYASKPGLAAPPGTSLHQQGLAIDVDTGYLAANPWVRQYLDTHGWSQFDVSKEPWHFSYGTTG
jgi:hypothetical protein